MAERPESELAGKVLAGRYHVLDLLGVGGMGAVYRALDRELDEVVALKVIRRELADAPVVLDRFRQEVKLARRVTHASVARTFELGHADGLMFFTMELVDGESLTRRLRRQGRLPVGEATAIACSVCDALAAAHAAGVIHRDIKPDNVLIARDGRVVVADFGVAAIGRDDGDASGTPGYMAPEQARGEPPTPAADVHAVGVMLREMLSGERTATATTADDPGLADVIARATAPSLADRTPTAAALRAELAGWATPSRPVSAVGDSRRVRAGEVHTVVVLAPRADGDGARLYLAEAVRERMLRQLARETRLRVLSRGEAQEQGASVVALRAGDLLTVTVTPADAGPPTTLSLPLTVGRLEEAASAAAQAVATGVLLARREERGPATEALDLLLQARHIGQQDVALLGGAIARLERASALLPRDPSVAANLAIAHVRQAFFAAEESAERMARAAELVRTALATGPDLAETHLAAGHLRLNRGEASSAAAHYRTAIACASHLAEPHEYLGRMLLEAGFVDDGLARLDDALAIAPSHLAIRWDIARAFALERRWADHDRVMADLEARGFHRPSASAPLRARFAIWRGDRAALDAIRREPRSDFDPALVTSSLAVYLDGAWAAQRDLMVRRARDTGSSIRRRRAFAAQMVAEAAGFAGDAGTCVAMLELSVSEGLFDLHWLDRCPLLEVARAAAGFAGLRAHVAQRAGSILDALHGDHEVSGMSDTVRVGAPMT